MGFGIPKTVFTAHFIQNTPASSELPRFTDQLLNHRLTKLMSGLEWPCHVESGFCGCATTSRQRAGTGSSAVCLQQSRSLKGDALSILLKRCILHLTYRPDRTTLVEPLRICVRWMPCL